MAIAKGLISLLFNIALSGEVPFHQPQQQQQLQCLHHGSTKTHLCTPFPFPLPLHSFSPYHISDELQYTCKASVQDLGTAVNAKQAGALLRILPKRSKSWK